MPRHLFLLLWLCATLSVRVTAQKVIEVGPSLGISFPKPIMRNLDIDRIKPGAMLGVNVDIVRKSWVKNLYFNTGVMVNCFLFEQTPSLNFRGTAVGLYGLSFGFPFKLQHHIVNDGNFIFRYTVGAIPLWESKALVRNNDPDGGLRFNVSPELSASIVLYKSNSIGFRWFMPLREYGAQDLGNTFRLINFSFFASWCLKKHDFTIYDPKPRRMIKAKPHPVRH